MPKAGPHMVAVTFLATNNAPGNDLDQHFLRDTIETGGLPGYKFFPHVGKIRIDGPNNPKGAGDTPSRHKIFVCHPASPANETACAETDRVHFGAACVPPPRHEQDTEMLMGFYQLGRNDGGNFDHGIEMAFRRILVDPEFYFRKEPEPANAETRADLPHQRSRARLPPFLLPLEQRSRRPSSSTWRRRTSCTNPPCWNAKSSACWPTPSADALIDNFAGQWLNVRGLQTQVPVTSEFPGF